MATSVQRAELNVALVQQQEKVVLLTRKVNSFDAKLGEPIYPIGKALPWSITQIIGQVKSFRDQINETDKNWAEKTKNMTALQKGEASKEYCDMKGKLEVLMKFYPDAVAKDAAIREEFMVAQSALKIEIAKWDLLKAKAAELTN